MDLLFNTVHKRNFDLALKGASCHRSFAVNSIICCRNLYLVPNYLFPKCSNRLTETSNKWWLREQTLMNFWQYSQGMVLEFEKKWLVFSNFNSFPSLPCEVTSNKWFRCSDKGLGNKTASVHYFWVSIDVGTYFGIVK